MTDADVLFIDDEADIRQVMQQTFLLEGLKVEVFADGDSALRALTPDFCGVILCDYHMPGRDGLSVLAEVMSLDNSIPVIILTGHGDISTAVTAMQQGAYDFIEKPFNHEELIELLRKAREKRQLALENRYLKGQLNQIGRPGPRLLGTSAQMQRLLAMVDTLAPTSADILLHGETGAGKDALARFIHERSPRSGAHYVAINCGAVPEHLIESELFGHEAGAFTGAERRRIGKFEHAHGGTLFLDEVESMPSALQVKLLRVLEERKVERLGSNQPIAIDVRIIAATKADLRALSDTGEFRADLYYRLNVVEVQIPPLRQRPEDIPLLFQHFALIAAEHHGREIIPLQPEQAAYLKQQPWPGNVRELRNLAERYVLMGPAALENSWDIGQPRTAGTLAETMAIFERSLLQDALRANNGSIKDTMEQLGLARKTLYDKMKKHGLDKSFYKD
ncbi:sigma-54-dependent Fis family transcriptional regulator [Natronospirillum operosum]|uniref:Sigma-54-dependent Fis family transcriptional regulator n=1 Tax=Natronospirillum operosum TaxID=2759953 RepID=A0A4Z0WF65_9GAMM|nr:sigma-54 dependent transcriptional regulator [Natronospirillum operosum]TGG93936.1 sigma-54-dependent Fis family transcriptional regulator [Natronospirillum operosum]